MLWPEEEIQQADTPEAVAENKASLGTLSTGVPSDKNMLNDIVIEDNEHVTTCCC